MGFGEDDGHNVAGLRGDVILVEAQKSSSETSLLLRHGSDLYASTETTLSSTENEDGVKNTGPVSRKDTVATISLLFIGVFVANVDLSLVLATNSAISSSFSQLQSASWLTTSYVRSTCTAQPIVWKLIDIFGRKNILLVSYILFAIGSGLCGVGQSLWPVIAGRSIAGLGGAGMTVIVTVLITDMVPMIEVASWRSYVNVSLTIFAALLVALKFKKNVSLPNVVMVNGKVPSRIGKVDFIGAALLSTGIVSFLFAVDFVVEHESEQNTKLAVTASLFLVLTIAFLDVEANYTKEPIFPPRLMSRRDVATTYLINMFQSAIMFSVPLYWQVTSGASDTAASSRLVPAFVGNTFGSLLTGWYIKRTGRYKIMILLASLSACTAYITIPLRWHGDTYSWEALEIAPGGFGSGVATTSTFIALIATMSHENLAVATAGFYLASNLGIVLSRLPFTDRHKLKIVAHVLANVQYLRKLKEPVRELVLGSYIQSLEYNHIFSLFHSSVAFLIALAIHEHSLV
ncbi:related to multidrug resistance protein fnx1 [Phialocephala subalpina]|uniref:Related to multidrug resistance protein fnx1 n=1 Tax=Phialocephala subalpina TaxID=576137 RepID=A0A1L7X7Q6_9HELO|nr:related to multidrug resistance protein fnx1 [Phialocephala subalpina]